MFGLFPPVFLNWTSILKDVFLAKQLRSLQLRVEISFSLDIKKRSIVILTKFNKLQKLEDPLVDKCWLFSDIFWLSTATITSQAEIITLSQFPIIHLISNWYIDAFFFFSFSKLMCFTFWNMLIYLQGVALWGFLLLHESIYLAEHGEPNLFPLL